MEGKKGFSVISVSPSVCVSMNLASYINILMARTVKVKVVPGFD